METVSLIVLVGVLGIPAVTCVLLARAGLGRGWVAGAAALLGGWVVVSAVLAELGIYRNVPWLPVAVVGELLVLLALARIPAVARAVAVADLARAQVFRVAGLAFLIALALGRVPAVFALPAGLGDIAVGLAAWFGGRRSVLFNVLGLVDLVVAVSIGGVVGFGLFGFAATGAALGTLPLALIPTTAVPLAAALHIETLRNRGGARGRAWSGRAGASRPAGAPPNPGSAW